MGFPGGKINIAAVSVKSPIAGSGRVRWRHPPLPLLLFILPRVPLLPVGLAITSGGVLII